MSKFHVKKGDQVVVLAGKEKGKSGKIIHVMTDKQRVVVEGLQMIKKHTQQEPAEPERRDCRARRFDPHLECEKSGGGRRRVNNFSRPNP